LKHWEWCHQHRTFLRVFAPATGGRLGEHHAAHGGIELAEFDDTRRWATGAGISSEKNG